MSLNEPWNLKSRARECAATQRPFDDGEAIFTALFQAADGSFTRLDFSSEGWQHRLADAGQAPPFSSWQSRFRVPDTVEKPQVVHKENAEDLLRRLVEEDDEATENVRYILAVMLERQRLLRETDRQRTATGILRVYEHRKTGEVLIIRDPDIPLDQVEKVQAEIMAMLEPRESPADPETGQPTPQEDNAESSAADAQPDATTQEEDPPAA